MESQNAQRKSAAKKKTKKKTKATAKKSSKKAGGKKASKKSGKKTSARKRTSEGSGVEVDIDGNVVRVSREIGGRTLTLETGRMAKQADGAVVARYGDTVILATAQSASGRDDLDFLPLTVDYRERYPAAGKFPGGFFKREGRPSTREVLTCRIIDRSIRPLFPDGFRKEVQVLSQVLSTDVESEADILAAVGSFAALAISSIPHEKHLGAVRIGLIDDEFVINPTWTQIKSEENKLSLTVAGHADAVVMVEAGANEIEEGRMVEALDLAKSVAADIAELVGVFAKEAGKEKMEWIRPERNTRLDKSIESKFGKDLRAAACVGDGKDARAAARRDLLADVHEGFAAPEGVDPKAHKKYVSNVCKELIDQGERESILKGTRSDGRDWKKVRQITIEVGVLPRVHGSVLFTRGETQALCVTTLGTVDDMQKRDGVFPEDPQHFMLHYSFPPFCVGEVRRMMGVGRREIGHGSLAERAVTEVLPPREEFPYTMRVTSEILESNGSSSMASVCGGTLSLMDAGVPLRQPVAGIAMGLVMEGDDYAILSDILGSEDHCGDMDFKVAGTGKGITALQMDIKCEGLTQEILTEAMEQARQGRLFILREMLKALARPRSEVSPNAPRILTAQIPVEKIGFLIGPSGKNIRAMQANYEVKISIDDTGLVNIGGFDAKKAEACAAYIADMTREVEPGEVYNGRVTSIKDFGCFVEILPGQEGLCHVSELSNSFIHAVTDVVRIGDNLEVKVLDIDDFGKIKLSHKAILSETEDEGDDRVFRRGGGRSADDFEDESDEEDLPEEEGVDESDEIEVDSADSEEDEPEEEEEAEDRPRRGSSRGRGRDEGRGRGRTSERGRDDGGRGRRDSRDDRSSRRDGGSRGGRDDRPERSSRGGRDDRPERSSRGGRDDRPERSSRGGRDDRPERSSRGGRDDRPERSSRGGRDDRPERSSRGDRDRGDRGGRSDRGDRESRRDRDRDESRRETGGRDEFGSSSRPQPSRSGASPRSREGSDDRDREERPRGRSRSRDSEGRGPRRRYDN